MRLSILFAIGLGLSAYGAWAQSSAPGFEGKREFVANIYEGTVHMTCSSPNGGHHWATYTCVEDVLDPSDFARFTSGPVDANEVSLVSQRADGKTVEKSGDFDGVKGESTRRFNLWIETVLQTALLDVGINNIRYELKKDGAVVDSGAFPVQVTRGPDFLCERLNIFSSNEQDCRSSLFACNRYFSQARCQSSP